MDLIPSVVTVILFALAVCGAFVRPSSIRIVFWVLSLPPLGIGCLALWQGGIAKPFSGMQMLGFCAVAFSPAIGCAIGQIRAIGRKKSQNQKLEGISEYARVS